MHSHPADWEVGEHHGTHLDSPAHFVEGGTTAEKLPSAGFVAPLTVIGIRERVKRDTDAALTIDDLLAWEKQHGKLPTGAAVFMNSGWTDRAGTPVAASSPVSPVSRLFTHVRVLYYPDMRGRIVELRGPLGPGGAQRNRVRFRRKPNRCTLSCAKINSFLSPTRN